MEEASIARALKRLRREPAPTSGPLVSMVVTNRDGEEHLRRLIKGLRKRTNYGPIEVVLVDNGSTDGSIGALETWTGQKQLLSNGQNQSFSASNNQGIRAAQGELVLLANNDIDPIHPDWLGFMVDSLADGVAAVGAMLVYPKRRKRENPPKHPDLTVQHLGGRFEKSKWGVRAFNSGAGADPLAVSIPDRREMPVVTAACLLARRADLLAHPFDEAYWYGSEDWDLCLRLSDTGKILIDERAVLFHHEFGTQDKYMSEAWLERRAQNHQWFNGLWGPSLMRQLRTEGTGPEISRYFGRDRQRTVSIVSSPDGAGHDLAKIIGGQALQAGWTVRNQQSGTADMVIATSPPADVHRFAQSDLSVAIVLDQESEWTSSGSLDSATRVVVPSHFQQARLDAMWGAGIAEVNESLGRSDPSLFAQLLEAATTEREAMRIGISTCAPDWTKAQFWGETFLARGLMRAFRRLGHEANELIMADWQRASATSCDVIIHLRGLTRRPVSRGQWNLLWIISHPDRIEPGECDDYDLIASASPQHADQLSAELGRKVHYLPQATDADTFKLGPPAPDYETQILYAGVARWPPRRAPRWLMRNGRSFHLYGRNWEHYPEAGFLRGEHIPNRDLASAYRSADVVVADHHGSMRTNGFVANRLFDVLASGGVVLSDDVVGVEELFADSVPTYSDAHELESQLRILLADAALRRRLSAEGRRRVSSSHTLDHRANQWLQMLDEL